MAEYLNIKTAAKRLGMSERAVRRKCNAGKLPGSRKLKGRWNISEVAVTRLCQIKPLCIDYSADDLMWVPLPRRTEAIRKLGIVIQFEKLSAHYVKGGGLRSDILIKFAKKKKISERTLQRWIKKCNDKGIMGLVDSRGGLRA